MVFEKADSLELLQEITNTIMDNRMMANRKLFVLFDFDVLVFILGRCLIA
jgi:hypothetical protein